MEKAKRENQLKKDVFMALAVFISLTIILLHVAFYRKKPLGFLVNSIIFMLISLLTSNYMTLMIMKFKLYEQTQDVWLFICLLIFRQIFIPVIAILFINFLETLKTTPRKIMLFISTIIIMLGLNYLMLFFGIIKFRNWNFILEGMVDAGYLLIAFGLAKILLFMSSRESR